MARSKPLLTSLIAIAVGMGLALTPVLAQQEKAEAKVEKKPASASKAKKPQEAGKTSVFACPKCSAKGADFTAKKAGACPDCKMEMVTERNVFQCPKCKGVAYKAGECKKCKEKMTPALASWDCEACKWHSAAKRKEHCGKPTKETVVADNTQFECSKCQIRNAKGGKCSGCGAAMTKPASAPTAVEPKKS